MTGATTKPRGMSLEEYLLWEAGQELRYELVDGQTVMMTGGTAAHGSVRAAIIASLYNQLLGRPCRVAVDMKISCLTGNVRYPDVAVLCGPLRPKDVLATGPRVVIEVLSDSTRAADFLIKSRDYQSVPDIAAYLIFWQDEARVLVRRRLGEAWRVDEEILGLEAKIVLGEVGAELSLAHIYGELFAQ